MKWAVKSLNHKLYYDQWTRCDQAAHLRMTREVRLILSARIEAPVYSRINQLLSIDVDVRTRK